MIYKFATMLKNSSKMKCGIITIQNYPRVTFKRGFLRKSNINELPQLVNILITTSFLLLNRIFAKKI